MSIALTHVLLELQQQKAKVVKPSRRAIRVKERYPLQSFVGKICKELQSYLANCSTWLLSTHCVDLLHYFTNQLNVHMHMFRACKIEEQVDHREADAAGSAVE